MSRARPPILVMILALGSGALSCVPPRPGTPPEHLLLITVSGLRADHVTAWMYPRPTTVFEPPPVDGVDLSIDGLAESGVRFSRAFSTSADSGTALRSLHTGFAFPMVEAPTLAEAFDAAGFETAAFVTGAALGPELARGFGHVVAATGEDPDYEAVRSAVAWMREVGEPSGARLFVWLHLSGPAAPWQAGVLGKEDFVARFVDPDYAGVVDGSAANLTALQDPEHPLDGLDLSQLVALYDAEIARANHLLLQFASAAAGRFDLLPRDLLSNAVVVLAGDRGTELLQHGRAAEDPQSLFDASLHVPLVLRHPASMTGQRVLAEPVDLRDVAPTIRAWFGLTQLDVEGRSLLALTDSYFQRPFARRPVVLRRGETGGSVRTPLWHLIVRDSEHLLFDTQADPLERVNLAEELPNVVLELKQHLEGPKQ